MHDLRKDFPILHTKSNGLPLIYMDNAATTQKPYAVIEAITNFYTHSNNNIHRSVYQSGERTTQLYEQARTTVARFINADPDEIIFTKGTTEGINFIAQAWAVRNLKAGDEIVLSELEHHSNLVPWLVIATAHQLTIKYIPINADGLLNLDQLSSLITAKTKLVSITHVSNALGSQTVIVPVVHAAHSVGARVFIDAAQSIGHQPLDVTELKTDFLAFSGHKMFGPTGIGVLYIKKELHDQVSPYQYGGGMIYYADYHHATWQKAPHCFEAGTPPIAQAVGLAAAITYIESNISWNKLKAHEAALCTQLIEGLSKHKLITIFGPSEQLKQMGHIVSFSIDGMHAHDVATFLSTYGICVRAGNHCAQPLATKMQVPSSVRVSFHVYNTPEEVTKLLACITFLINKNKMSSVKVHL